MVTVLIIELDDANPAGRLDGWLAAAGAEVTVLRAHAGDPIPADIPPVGALICLGGRYGIYDDDAPTYLAQLEALLRAAVAASMPLLAIGLSAQLLAVAAGGRVEAREDGYRLGAALAAKRDATEHDLLLGMVPITPDVMQFHRDTITMLPGGSTLLLSSPTDPVEAFRVGSAAWGVQFHIETSAATLRSWRAAWTLSQQDIARSERAFGPGLDEAEQIIGEVWPGIIARFVQLVADGIPDTPTGRAAPRLPLV